jgi:hypothetical protein
MVCAVLHLYTPSWCWYTCPKIGTNSINWAQLSRFYLKTETETSLRNVVFCNINRTVFLDNTQKQIILLTYYRHKILDLIYGTL